MEVILAKTAGFCFGVRRAVETVYQQVEKGNLPIYTYGPIIHNEQVVEALAAKGVQVVNGEEELELLHRGTIIIRSHGVGRAVQEKMEAQGLTVVDATCPFVKKIHRIVEEASAAGGTVVIVGDRNHPEVQGICGWCHTKPYVVSTLEEIDTIPRTGKQTVVSQTTFHHKKFQELVEKMEEKGYHSSVVNTICNATQERQMEARTIAKGVEAMIVIGGKNSSNTQKLYDICKDECSHTYFVQTLVDLRAQCFPHVRSVGITAGASTPNNIIEEVHTYVRSKL